MSGAPAKPLHLPWNQSQQYWLCVLPRAADPSPLAVSLKAIGMQELREGSTSGFALLTEQHWAQSWGVIYQALEAAGALSQVDAAVVSADSALDAMPIEMARKPCDQIQRIAQSLWLGEALMHGDVLCYLQPVVAGNDRVFGYESFARVRKADGTIIGGASIVEACKALSIEYTMDRQLQVQAIKTFVESEFAGSLFVNFFPGFIQRPEVYLEGLNDTVRAHGVVPKHVVLDVTRSESTDMQQLKRVCDYCRTKGYALALDDVESPQHARILTEGVRPDYVKMDMKLVHKVSQPTAREAIRSIVECCHQVGAMVIAEGVETEEVLKQLKDLQVDLFQGYYFSPPVPVEQLKEKKAV